MYRGTTPSIIFRINSDIDLENIKQVYVTFKTSSLTYKSYELTKEIDDVFIDNENKTISVSLTQEETLAFNASEIRVQLRLLTSTGSALASNIKSIMMNDILKEGVIE